MTECPRCKSTEIVAGRIAAPGHSMHLAAAFIPNTIKWYQFSMEGSATLKNEVFACAKCGYVCGEIMYLDQLHRLMKAFPEDGRQD